MPAPVAAPAAAKLAKVAGKAAAGRAARGRRSGGQGGGPGPGTALVVALLLLVPAALVVGLVLLAAVLGGAQQQSCSSADAAGALPGDFSGPGSLGGVGGTGLSRAQVHRVRSGSPYAGRRVTKGRYNSTAYGPPWGGIQGAGLGTSGGLVLGGRSPRWYMIAVDPAKISHGTFVYVWPNPFGWKGPFLAADTGGAIQQHRIDFYDWRGRAMQNRWGRRTVQASPQPIVGGGPAMTDTKPAAAPTGGGTGSPSYDVRAATAAARSSRASTVGFAVADRSGQLVAQHNANARVRGASITKAMLLVAYLQKHPRSRSGTLAAMIQRSDNAAGNAIYRAVGRRGVRRVADRAGMTDFRLDDSPSGAYVLGDSLVTAGDQARLFARIDRLLPSPARRHATQLLGNLSPSDRWGILDAPAAANGHALSKAGWKTGPGGGWIVNQGAQVSGAGGRVGVAVVSSGNRSFGAGQKTMENVAGALLHTSSASAAAGGGCGGADVKTVPGSKAKILPNGEAAAPADAPAAVKKMIAAGNAINGFPYSWGGGHGAVSQTMNQKRPNPRAAPGQQENGGPGYDCSSATSYVIYGGGFGRLLANTVPVSGDLAGRGKAGKGRWVTWYANGSHVFIEVAGIYLDTAGGKGRKPRPPNTGPRWTPNNYASGNTSGFSERHPAGL